MVAAAVKLRARRLARSIARRAAWCAFACAVLLVACDAWVGAASSARMARSPSDVPELPVALLLGCAPTVAGRPNAFFRARIRAAAELWHAGRVRGVLASGDHGRVGYDEPEAMRRALVDAGVPDAFITLDHAGFRTLDSVVRAKEVFGQHAFVVVSQEFHARRALFLARRSGCDAWGYAADDPAHGPRRWRVRAREVLARAKAAVDVVAGVEPRFLGRREVVRLAER